ncbi:hypothetical protein [Actinoplanes palleronii]|uniref:Uncharacterized protein n=1 Tax=Actinoplanes palleronii TaxID=113570 RepID=A0ABQ4B426_9ACTN|nr:hypothetical protein [Actinoplanes palleronii]GIE65417.1 hypothetical protein Apa02nite_015250 [Actinoplanes palleronii]
MELEERIAARLNRALDQLVGAGAYAYADDDRGLAAGEPGSGSVRLRLTVDEVARIAAQEARDWF